MPADVPARVASWTAWILLAMFAAAILFAVAVRLPETVPAVFVLEAREGAEPWVRLIIPEPAFARLRPGQEVRLHYYAYPHQRHGWAAATLDKVNPAGVDRPEGSGITATATLQAGPAGHRIEPHPGMRGEAQILMGRRTLLQRALE